VSGRRARAGGVAITRLCGQSWSIAIGGWRAIIADAFDGQHEDAASNLERNAIV